VEPTLGLPVLGRSNRRRALFDFLNGLHDAANSIATIVSTRVLRPQYGCLGGVLHFVSLPGVRLNVARTIGTGISSPA